MKRTRFRICRKTLALIYKIEENVTKDQLANALHDSLKINIDIIIIAKIDQKYHVYLEFERKLDTREKHYFNILIDEECYEPEIITTFRKTEYIERLVINDPDWYEEGIDTSKYIRSTQLKKGYQKLVIIEKLRSGVEPDDIEEEYSEFYFDNAEKVNKYALYHKLKKRRLEATIGFIRLDIEKIDDDKQKVIAEWYNIRIVDRFYEKPISGIYIWSRMTDMGKTALVKLLMKIDRGYTWTYNDGRWQQKWNKGMNYKFIVFNALNGPYIEFETIEQLGDEVEYNIPQRYETDQGYITPGLPFIITSNKPPEELGYPNDKKVDTIWYSRMLVVELKEPIFPLLDLIRETHGLKSFEQEKKFSILDNPILSNHIQYQRDYN